MARPAISASLLAKFPARVSGTAGIRVDRTGGTYTIRQDWSNIQQEVLPPDPENYEFLFLGSDGSFIRVQASEIILPVVTWDTLSGKPTTFPPSAHTHPISDVDLLQAALDAKYDSGDVIPVANGGSGRATATAYALIAGGTTGTGAHQSLAGVGTAGQVLTSNGAAALPTFQAPTATPSGTMILVAQVEQTATQTTASTSAVDVTGLSITFTAKASTKYCYVFDGFAAASTTNFVSFVCTVNGSGVGLGAAAGSRVRVTRSAAPGPGGGHVGFRTFSTPGAGSTTAKVQFLTSSGNAHLNKTDTDTDTSLFPRGASTFEVWEIVA